jgi:hypothetical protein
MSGAENIRETGGPADRRAKLIALRRDQLERQGWQIAGMDYERGEISLTELLRRVEDDPAAVSMVATWIEEDEAESDPIIEQARRVCALWSDGEDVGDAITALSTAVEAAEPISGAELMAEREPDEGSSGDAVPGDVSRTDAPAYAPIAARALIGDLRIIAAVDATDDLSRVGGVSNERLESLGFDLDPDCEALEDQAGELMDSIALAVEATTTFEVVLGCGGPDVRLCFECVAEESAVQPDPHTRPPLSYEIRHVLYVYTWEGRGEVELYGDDREVAEAFGRRVVPELVG